MMVGQPMSFSVGTVLFGGYDTLERTLPTWSVALAEHSDIRVRVIDNSPRTLPERIADRLTSGLGERLDYARSASNVGFAAAANRLIRECEQEWLFLVNADVYLDSSAIHAIREHLASERPVSSAISIDTGGAVTLGVALSAYGYFGDRHITSRVPVLGPSGGAALLHAPTFRDHGWYFDEDLFAWGEDAGLAVRLYASGVRTQALDLRLEHVGGHSVSSLAGQRLKSRLLARNRLLVLRRDFSRPFLAVIGPAMVVVMLLNGMRKIALGTSREHFRGMWEGLTQRAQRQRPTMSLRMFLGYLRHGDKPQRTA